MNSEDVSIMNYVKNMYYLFKESDIVYPDRDLKEGALKLNKLNLYILETPGHTPGSICLKIDDILFTDDTLFKESIGRTDLGGDINLLVKSIHNKLFKLSMDMRVYPAHGEYTSIKNEIYNNPYVGINGIYPYKIE